MFFVNINIGTIYLSVHDYKNTCHVIIIIYVYCIIEIREIIIALYILNWVLSCFKFSFHNIYIIVIQISLHI